MMKNIRGRVIVGLFLSGLLGCSTSETEEKHEQDEESELGRSSLVGTWENVDLVLTIKNGDSDSIVRLDESNWVEKLQMLPIRTTFKEDSTFESIYRDPDGKQMMSGSGSWYIRGDSIFMREWDTDTRYFYDIDGNRVRFKGYLDWDQDGEPDDLYNGTQRRILQ